MKLLATNESINPTPIILGIIGGVVVIAAILVLLYFLVFRKNQYKKKINELDSRFQYLHALLQGQDSQYVRRLEIISRTNLLYVEIHTKYLKRFKEVRDKFDTKAQSTINHLKDLIDEKDYKTLKEALGEAKDVISTYEKEVNNLNNALLSVVKPEEDCRQSCLPLQEDYRRIKQEYGAKQTDLQLVSDSFEQIFNYIDDKLAQFEDCVDSAQYEEANQIIPEIHKILVEVSNAMGELPNLCATVLTVIPEKLASLEDAHQVMLQDNYPLNHLRVNASIKEIKAKVDLLTVRIKRFDLKGVGSELENIISQIEEFFNLFEEEKKAREKFEAENENVYSTVNTIERRFIKLRNNIPNVSKIYIINDQHANMINQIQNDINKLGALKRSLDTFIHSSTKQPYSLLVSKMDELTAASNTVIKAIDEFQEYIASLKIDTENAYKLVFEYYQKIKENEAILHNIAVPTISDKYQEKLEHLFSLLNDTFNLIVVTPINVDRVNEYVSEMHEINNELFDSGSISRDNNMMIAAETAILLANRERHHLSEINSIVNQSEVLFYKGEFEESYKRCGDALNKNQNVGEHEKR